MMRLRILKQLKYIPRSYLLPNKGCMFLTSLLECMYSTADSISFSNVAILKYLNKLEDEYRNLKNDINCADNKKKKHRLSELSIIASLLKERKTLHTNIASLNELLKAILKYLNKLEDEYRNLKNDINCADNKKKKHRLSELSIIASLLTERKTLHTNIASLNELLKDVSKDKDLQEAAEQEQRSYLEKLKEVEELLLSVIIPSEENDSCTDVVLEVSAGVGGQEAMLFAAELFGMYCNYISYRGWQSEIAELEHSEIGGIRHASILISGEDVYQCLKYEAGIHRVQRVPATEKSGRIHTSTVSVALLFQPSEIEVELKDKDLRIETKRASGAGGQHVNKTESAVRITHIPTGIAVECQVDRSQIRNRQIALQTLRTRIFEQQKAQQITKSQATRKQQVGSSSRSEKIRTYNFNQDRITDHRLDISYHGMKNFLLGEDLLDRLIQHINQMKRKEKLMKIIHSQEADHHKAECD